jgi:LacI family transcriptional regulator
MTAPAGTGNVAMREAGSSMATIKDVAREAGVSTATVSRVFNHSRIVSDETRRQVREVAARLNYWPNAVARSLITNRTHTVGLLLPELHGEFFSSVIRGIDLASRREGLHLLVSSSHADTQELVDALLAMRGRIDGLIVMAPDVDAPAAIRDSAGHIPIVLLDPGGTVDGHDTLSIANFEGAHEVVRHLLSLGHRSIATVTGPERNVDARERVGGYRAALREAGAEVAPRLEIAGDFTEPSGFRAGTEIVKLNPRPTAVFVGNDHMAVGVLRAIHEAGLRVPEDIAVAGFDDIEMSRYLDPPLTTVRVDTFTLGEQAVSLLMRASRGEMSPRHTRLPTTLVVRRSCGAGRPSVPPASPAAPKPKASRRGRRPARPRRSG